MSKKSKRYDPAYKLEICKSVESATATVAELSRETGLNKLLDNTSRMMYTSNVCRIGAKMN